jgi:dihydrofolate reductase
MFLAAGLVDEVYLTIEPVLFGQGIPFTREPLRVPLKLLDTTNLNASTVLLHYAIEK